MLRFGLFLGVLALSLAACGGGGGGSSSAPPPVPTATPTDSPTPNPSPTPTPSPSPTPTVAPLDVTYATSYQAPSATPYPAAVPIELFAQGQTALLTVSGGTQPYAGQLLFCSSGAGFGAPFAFVQNANQVTFTLTATQYAGSCTVNIFDSSNPFKSIQLQATLTTTTGTVQ